MSHSEERSEARPIHCYFCVKAGGADLNCRCLAALIVGINHHYLLDDYTSTVRKDMQQAFGGLYRPGLRWIDKFKRGHRQPAMLVLEKYQNNPRMVYAILSPLEEQHPTATRLNCPWPNNNQSRAKAHKALMKAYGCST